MSSFQMKWGAVLTFSSMALTMFVGIYFTPHIIALLGKQEYGLYNLLRSFVGYFYLLEFGLGTAIIRYVAKYTVSNELKKRDQIISLSLLIFLIIDFVLFIIAFWVYQNAATVFPKLNLVELQEAKTMLLYLFSSVLISIPSGVFLAALAGTNLFIVPRLFALLSEIIRIIGILLILNFQLNALALIILSSGIAILSAFVNIYYTFYKLKLKLVFNWDKILFKKLANFSFYIFLGMIMSQIYWSLDIYLIGTYISMTAVAVYAIAMQLNGIFLSVTTAITSVLLPKATELTTNKNTNHEITLFTAKAGRFILMIYLLLLLGFVFFGKQFIKLWLGTDFEEVYVITLVVVLASFIPRLQGGINDVVKAKNKHKFLAVLYASMALLNIVLTIIFLKKWGIIGAAYATALGLVLGNVFIANLYYKNTIKIDLQTFFKALFHKFYLTFLPMLLIGYAINYFFEIANWHDFIAQIFAFGLVYSMLIWKMTLLPSEKSIFLSFIKR